MRALILGMVIVWILGAIITAALHFSIVPWMPITWQSITSIWGLLMVFIVIVCSFDFTMKKKKGTEL